MIDGDNGFVVWNDEELFEKVNHLIGNEKLRNEMGWRGAELGKQWDWHVDWSEHVTGLMSRT